MSSWNLRQAKATCLWLPVVLTLGAGSSCAQEAQDAQPAPAEPFKAEEIEALVAPIALYPDSVLSPVSMVSTYPLEIVHAAR
ncbi:hypothetical protein PTKU15_80190 [Paraburkholderia terrae]|nr:hypothetical protein PTKU15_80190 [Paraburkholderia terrae]